MEDFPMSSQQLQTIANDSLFEIGVHTVTHPSLSLQTNEMQRNEIAECKQYLESRYSKRMHTISYPYGDFNATTLDIVKEQKLYGAFTTDERVITKRTDPACAGRFQVKNWNGSDFKKQLEHWFKHY
jgi:peptidoglycan/xylan/chitin deacetylase (PgdA/CDA1 family)